MTPLETSRRGQVFVDQKLIHAVIDKQYCSSTSDSLNEGLPIKITREKFERKQYFFYEKDSVFNPRHTLESSLLIGQVSVEKYGLKTLFLLFNI